MKKNIFSYLSFFLLGSLLTFGIIFLGFKPKIGNTSEKIEKAFNHPEKGNISIPQTVETNKEYDITWKFKEFDFGKIKQHTKKDSVTFSFIVNSGIAQMTGSKSNCGCTLGKWKPTKLKLGETGSITIKYDTKRLGYFNKTFQIYINRNKTPETLRIKGSVYKPE